MDDAADPEDRFADIVRALHNEEGTRDTLQMAVSLATEMVEGCDHACVSLVHRGRRIDTPAYTSALCRRGDELQYELQQGPCLDAVWDRETVHSPDLRLDPRWPRWGRRVGDELGVRSMLCFQLYTTDLSLGALNLYAGEPDAFTATSETVGLALAAHIAVALAGELDLQHANQAITNRTVIGQAQGILMERYDLDPAQAFRALVRMSQDDNVKLHLVAGRIVAQRRGVVLGEG